MLLNPEALEVDNPVDLYSRLIGFAKSIRPTNEPDDLVVEPLLFENVGRLAFESVTEYPIVDALAHSMRENTDRAAIIGEPEIHVFDPQAAIASCDDVIDAFLPQARHWEPHTGLLAPTCEPQSALSWLNAEQHDGSDGVLVLANLGIPVTQSTDPVDGTAATLAPKDLRLLGPLTISELRESRVQREKMARPLDDRPPVLLARLYVDSQARQ